MNFVWWKLKWLEHLNVFPWLRIYYMRTSIEIRSTNVFDHYQQAIEVTCLATRIKRKSQDLPKLLDPYSSCIDVLYNSFSTNILVHQPRIRFLIYIVYLHLGIELEPWNTLFIVKNHLGYPEQCLAFGNSHHWIWPKWLTSMAAQQHSIYGRIHQHNEMHSKPNMAFFHGPTSMVRSL